MKLTAAAVFQVGALICVTGALLVARLALSPHEILLVRALVAIILGLFFIQIGYAQSQREEVIRDLEKRPAPSDNPE
jgi:hypothetical protein